MRRIRYSVAASLDGYIAGPNGEADWIVMDPDVDFAASMAAFDTLLLGRRTFEAVLKMGGGQTTPGMTTVVVSRTLKAADYPKVTIVGDDVEGAIGRLRAAEGKDIWLFGGGSLFRSLLAMGLVDTVEVGVIPVMLGQGVPLLPGADTYVKLELTKHTIYPRTGTVGLEYNVKRGATRRKGRR